MGGPHKDLVVPQEGSKVYYNVSYNITEKRVPGVKMLSPERTTRSRLHQRHGSAGVEGELSPREDEVIKRKGSVTSLKDASKMTSRNKSEKSIKATQRSLKRDKSPSSPHHQNHQNNTDYKDQKSLKRNNSIEDSPPSYVKVKNLVPFNK
jgi:hypothetical protein